MIAHVATFLLKVVILIWLQMQIRWTLPRFRYDQVMDLCWKIILPLSLVNIFVTGALILLVQGAK
jgi:NADH-quinone oxidoreductase subunit H